MNEQNNIPDWAKELQVSAPAVESKPVRTVAPPKNSDAERIEISRALLIQRDRAANSDPAYGGRRTPECFIDPKGFGSAWFARHIVYLSQLLNTQLLGRALNTYDGLAEKYNPWTGVFDLNTPNLRDFSLIELMNAYKLRIQELGLSEVLLEEYNAEPRTWVEANAFYALPVEAQMRMFKSAKA